MYSLIQLSTDSPGAPPWLMIIIGLLVGVGIGMLIVVRAKRANPAERKKSGRE